MITELDSGASSLTAGWAVERGVRFSEARVYMETPEYRKLKAMIQSLKLNS